MGAKREIDIHGAVGFLYNFQIGPLMVVGRFSSIKDVPFYTIFFSISCAFFKYEFILNISIAWCVSVICNKQLVNKTNTLYIIEM